MVYSIFDFVDALLADFMPIMVRLCLLGTICGTMAISIYAIASPQKKIKAIKKDIGDSKGAAFDEDLEFKEVISLSMKNLAQSFRLLGVVLPPVCLSALPTVTCVLWLDNRMPELLLFQNLPSWLSGWQLPFFVSLAIMVLIIKFTFKIE